MRGIRTIGHGRREVVASGERAPKIFVCHDPNAIGKDVRRQYTPSAMLGSLADWGDLKNWRKLKNLALFM